MTEEPVPEGGPAGLLPGQTGFDVQVGDRDVLRADPLADLAVVAVLQPFGRDGFPLEAKALRIWPGQLRPGKEPSDLQNRTVNVTNGTLDALIDIGFHFSIFHHRGTGNMEKSSRKNMPKKKIQKMNSVSCSWVGF